MNPYLDKDRNPRVSVVITGLQSLTLNTYLDTGFTGGVAIPLKYKNYFHEVNGLIQRFMLANGTVMPVQLFEFKIKYKNTNKLVSGFLLQVTMP